MGGKLGGGGCGSGVCLCVGGGVGRCWGVVRCSIDN